MLLFGLEIPLAWILTATFLAWLVHYVFFGFDFFAKQGIPTAEPVLPLVGNIWKIWKRDNLKIEVDRLQKHGSLYGTFEGKNPVYVAADPEIIKAITIKDFDNFVDRRALIPENQKYVSKFLSVLHGQDWKDVRSGVSPVFSSGKIKRMSRLMEECCTSLVKVTEDRAAKNKGIIELKELFGVYTMDIIASCAFGTKIDALDDPNNPFIIKSQKVFRAPRMTTAFFLIPLMFPWVTKLGVQVFPAEEVLFFAELVKGIIATRRKENQKRGDVLDVMIEEMDKEAAALKLDPTRKPVMTEEVIVSQCVIFFLAGFDTTGTALSMCCHFLALDPEVQQKCLDEIRSTMKKFEGKICHEMIAECHYLDQVLNESLRIAPPAVKFAPENKGNIKPFTFLPFGNGSRNCIGMRFAQEEAKLALATIVHNFKLSKCEQTHVPFKTLSNSFMIQPVEMFVKFDKRE
ncbi:unnamed protein product [Notodromas monacha]|uniref:Cytochrome P450 n=1 Tax=Notodromas monacha TaxID=399045 RepID=A0A7R9BU30_9CRUS|nr:unnamed protein product [Notodromas monacha]CAG0920705.1 unnamed protein product [Notodromas monacha]